MAEASQAIVPIERVSGEPYRLALAYPAPDETTVESRVKQLRELGVSSLVFQGSLRVDRFSLLGKGVTALVVTGIVDDGRVALKIRRVDSRRADMAREAKMLQTANSVGVGPRYLGATADVLAMELVDGLTLPFWLSGLKGRGRRKRLRNTVRLMLDQCRRLDSVRVDHGELSRAHKNVLVAEKDCPWILDFESASSSRRPSNVTSLTQYLFLSGVMARNVSRVLGPVDRQGLLEGLRRYKAGEPSAFKSVMETLKLE